MGALDEPMTLEAFRDRALDLAVPFVERGRDWDGWDCWGLLRLAYRAVYGITLPSYTGRYTDTRQRGALAAALADYRAEGWAEVAEDAVRPGDALVLRVMGAPCHVGLVLAPPRATFLHAERRLGTCVESWSGAPWRGAGYDKVEGFYRHGRLQ